MGRPEAKYFAAGWSLSASSSAVEGRVCGSGAGGIGS
jgi:hypothetical protein